MAELRGTSTAQRMPTKITRGKAVVIPAQETKNYAKSLKLEIGVSSDTNTVNFHNQDGTSQNVKLSRFVFFESLTRLNASHNRSEKVPEAVTQRKRYRCTGAEIIATRIDGASNSEYLPQVMQKQREERIPESRQNFPITADPSGFTFGVGEVRVVSETARKIGNGRGYRGHGRPGMRSVGICSTAFSNRPTVWKNATAGLTHRHATGSTRMHRARRRGSRAPSSFFSFQTRNRWS